MDIVYFVTFLLLNLHYSSLYVVYAHFHSPNYGSNIKIRD